MKGRILTLLPDVTMGGGSACPIGNTERLINKTTETAKDILS